MVNKLNLKTNVLDLGIVITTMKGHELMLYEALSVIAGPFFKFTIVKM